MFATNLCPAKRASILLRGAFSLFMFHIFVESQTFGTAKYHFIAVIAYEFRFRKDFIDIRMRSYKIVHALNLLITSKWAFCVKDLLDVKLNEALIAEYILTNVTDPRIRSYFETYLAS